MDDRTFPASTDNIGEGIQRVLQNIAKYGLPVHSGRKEIYGLCISKGRSSSDADKASRESSAPVGKRKGGLRTQDAVYDPTSVRHTRQDAAGKSWC